MFGFFPGVRIFSRYWRSLGCKTCHNKPEVGESRGLYFSVASVSRVECFILVFYSVVYFAHLQIFSVLVHCWGIIYECQNTLRQSTLSPYTHRIVVVVSPQTSISSNNWVSQTPTLGRFFKSRDTQWRNTSGCTRIRYLLEE